MTSNLLRFSTRLNTTIISVVLVLFTMSSNAQLVISNQGAPAATILSGFIGTGLTISNAVINCPSAAYGTFSGGGTLGVTNGVILTTGDASQIASPESTNLYTNNLTSCSENALMAIEPLATNDCCILEFDVVPECTNLSIRFVFGSEEYPDYAPPNSSGYNDVFGFFVTGQNPSGGNYTEKNIAIVTGTTICSIVNVNPITNTGYYVDNSGGSLLAFGGYTTAITSSLDVVPCQSYHFKLAIADAGDGSYDSGVFIDLLECTMPMAVSTSSVAATCEVDDGTATAVVTGGLAPFTYTWTPAPGAGQGTANATGLVGGTSYTVEVDDNYACIDPVTSTIVVPTAGGGPTIPLFTPVADLCQGDPAPVLPIISTNGISGTWSPAVSTASAGTTTYTFTPTPGQCATTTTLDIVVTSSITPTFAAIASLCQNDPVPVLPGSSTNTPAITGVWSPAVNTASLGTTTYTFTSDAGQCAINTTMDIVITTPITPTFSAVPNVCQGTAAPVFPTNSLETPPITGTWGPVVSTAVAGTISYTFTFTPGQCATNATMDFTVDAPIVPSFAALPNVCEGDAAPVLPLSSTNTPVITGTWAPAVSTASAGTTTYTFTPDLGQCATTTTLDITVDPLITPTFASIANVCQGTLAPVLPLSSTNIPAVTGIWAPVVSTAAAGTTTYTFTPDAGQCAITTTLDITIDPLITPTFAAISELCLNSVAPVIPTSSTNTPAITGTWSPAISTASAGTTTYTFTPDAGICATTATMDITVTSSITPTFAAIAPVCQNDPAPILPNSSTNIPAITGTWLPVVSTATTGTTTYTFTSDPGQCGGSTTLDIEVSTPITPTFSAVPNVCQGTGAPVFPASSLETPPITGTWSPAVSTASAGTATYTFTFTPGQCATNTTMDFTVDAPIIPTFTAIADVCVGDAAPVLPSNSTNVPNISGTWSPLVSTSAAGTITYTFTPDVGQCATTTSMDITVIAPTSPTFTAVANVCQGTSAPVLPTNSTNGIPITGSWLPVVSTATSGTTTYTFSPAIGQCATTTSLNITVDPLITPTFTAIADVCINSPAPVLPTNSTNTPAITGNWAPAVSTATAGMATYTFTPTAGQCASNTSLNIVTTSVITPTFAQLGPLCVGDIAPVLPILSTNIPAISGVWSSTISTATSGSTTYSFTANAGQCAGNTTMNITVNPLPAVSAGLDQTICFGANPIVLSGSGASSFSWDNNVVNNVAFNPAVGTVTFTCTGIDLNGCMNTDQVDVIVNPLPLVSAGIDQTVCEGAAVTFSGTGASSYSWTGGITDNTSFIPSVGTVTYSVTGTDALGCTNTDQAILIVNPTPVVDAGFDVAICLSDTTNLLANGASTYFWDNGVGLGNNIPIFPLTTSNYTVVGTDVFGCIGSDQIEVIVNPLPSPNAGPDQEVCVGALVTLTAAGSSTFNWSDGVLDGIPFSSVSGTKEYTLTEQDNNGCVNTDTVKIISHPYPIADFVPNPSRITDYLPVSTMINKSEGAETYQWLFVDGDSSMEIDPKYIFPDSVLGEHIVILIATSDFGCKDTASAIITMNAELIYYIPNAFTPDGDNNNQTFLPVFTSGYDPYDYTLLIYDRWGEIVFESHDVRDGWSGLYGKDGVPVQDGVYTWKIEFKLAGYDKRELIIGTVSLMK